MTTKINYIEFYTTDIVKTKKFYSEVFGWEFTDYGPTYASFHDAGIDGGMEQVPQITPGGALIVLHHENLSEIREKIINAGGKITIDIFDFPGGSRFQFTDGYSTEIAICCTK
ncbi:MAG: VOC family protein [Minisyncoccia bacterium]